MPYALGQEARFRARPAAVAGNHVVIALRDRRAFVALVHLRRASSRVSVGSAVVAGQVLAGCGNSGISTEPHLHLQVTDGPEMASARGLALSFRPFREWVPVFRRELWVNCEPWDRWVWQACPVRIELTVTSNGDATLDIDGTPTGARPVSWLDGISQPHPLVWLSRERQYDVELWVGGELVGYVPGPDPEVEAAYEEAERRTA